MRALVTKLAAEHLCHAYGREYGLAVVSRAELIDRVEVLIGGPVPIEVQGRADGDVLDTLGADGAARRVLGWSPVTDLSEGLKHQMAWHQEGRP